MDNKYDLEILALPDHWSFYNIDYIFNLSSKEYNEKLAIEYLNKYKITDYEIINNFQIHKSNIGTNLNEIIEKRLNKQLSYYDNIILTKEIKPIIDIKFNTIVLTRNDIPIWININRIDRSVFKDDEILISYHFNGEIYK